jgi:diguanylate cyclase (GGDEF)-like protein
MSGVEPRDEHELRVWTPIAMWLAGSFTIGVATVLPHHGIMDIAQLRGLAGFGLCAAIFTSAVFRPASNRALYVLTNIFTALGSVTVWLACFWSGGVSSVFFELYFFPVLYAAYFFRTRHAACHLVLITALAASPTLYDASPRAAQFPGHLAVMVAALWGMAAVIGYRKRRLLIAEMTSREQALSDPLTGVGNLRSLRDRASLHPPAQGTGVLVIDIDDFKAVNTAYGHTGADELLRRVASELLEVADERDCVARIGGDEFAVLVTDRSRTEVEGLAARCVRAIHDAATGAGLDDHVLSGSVGHAIWPEGGLTLSELLATADREMFDAKASKRAGSEVPFPRETWAGAPAGPEPIASESPAVAGPRPRLVTKSPTAAAGTPGKPDPTPRAGRRRPPQAIAAAAAWMGAAATTLIVILLPGADSSHPQLAAAVIVGATAIGGLIILLGPVFGQIAYGTSDALAIPAIALAVYLTGGTTSPLLPLVFLAVAFAAYFYSSRGALLRLAGAVVVCGSPFLYASGDARVMFVLRFVALITTAAVLAGIILYNKRELAEAERVAREMATHDPLTGLPNRRAFHENVVRALELARGRGNPEPLSIAMIDLDDFKRVNDAFGHAAGDTVLLAIARGLSVATRPGDCVARIGGDEFALLARGVDASGTRALSVRCVSAVETAVARAGYSKCGVSATVGYALFPYHGITLDTLVDAADSALMDAKIKGKRQVSCAINGSAVKTASQ